MIGLVIVYVVMGFIASCVLHGLNGDDAAVDEKTLGQIVIWPFFILRGLLLGWWWVVTNLWDSLSLAGRQLFRGLDATD